MLRSRLILFLCLALVTHPAGAQEPTTGTSSSLGPRVLGAATGALGQAVNGGASTIETIDSTARAAIDQLPQLKLPEIMVRIHLDRADLEAICTLGPKLQQVLQNRQAGGQSLMDQLVSGGGDEADIARRVRNGLHSYVTLSDTARGGAPTDGKKLVIPLNVDVSFDMDAVMDIGMRYGEQEMLNRTQRRRFQPIRNLGRRIVRNSFYRGGFVYRMVLEEVTKHIWSYLGSFQNTVYTFVAKFGMGPQQAKIGPANQAYQGSCVVWVKEEGGAWKDVFRRSTAELRSDARDIKDLNLESIEAKIREIIEEYKKKAEDAEKARQAANPNPAASPASPTAPATTTGTTPDTTTGQGTNGQSE